MSKSAIFGDITRLIELAKAGNADAAKSLMNDLEARLGGFDAEFSERQRNILNKVRAQYRLDLTGSNQVLGTPITVDSFVKEVKPGVSLVTCCMNRSENLLKALKTWIDCPEINQIVIVDWSSTIPFRDELEASGIRDERILVARVNNQPRWILSYAYNFGFRLAGYDKILKTDADIMIGSTFFEENDLREKTFLSGDWRTAEKGQEHINGFFFIRQADLLSIKGFNEYITTYGWDDDDIYFRMEQQGFNRVRIKTSGVYHIPHDDAQRIDGNGKTSSALDLIRVEPGAKIMGNRFLAAAMPMWGGDRVLVPFEIILLTNNYLEARQSGESWYQVPPHIRADADYYGLCAALSWSTDLGAYFITKENLYALLGARPSRADITRMDVRLAACSEQPVCWHGNAAVLYFDEQVSSETKRTLVENILKLARKHTFTIFVEPDVFDVIEPEHSTSTMKDILPIPSGFYTHDLVQCEPSVLAKLPHHFQSAPAFWTKISPDDIERLSPIKTPQGSIRRSRLYIDVQHGLGNRLRALASATAIARQSDRDVVLIWTPDNHCDCHIHDLFDYDGEVVTDVATLDLEGAECYTYMEIEPSACKDQYIPLTPGRDLYIRSAYVINNELSSWENENQILRELAPVDAVMQLVRSVDAGGRIGLHVRMEGAAGTDQNSYDASHNWLPESHQELNLWRGKSHYSNFMARIDQMIKENPELKFFLAADTPETYRVFSERYHDRLVYLEREAYDRSKGQLCYALADALLLSQCDYMLGSTWSSFSELAQRFSITIARVEMSGTDF